MVENTFNKFSIKDLKLNEVLKRFQLPIKRNDLTVFYGFWCLDLLESLSQRWSCIDTLLHFDLLERIINFQFDFPERNYGFRILLFTWSTLLSHFFRPFEQIDLKRSDKYFLRIGILRFHIIIGVNFSHNFILLVGGETDLQIDRILLKSQYISIIWGWGTFQNTDSRIFLF